MTIRDCLDIRLVSVQQARILDCGGRAQRRHRFSTADRTSKAAWRFASRRTPKSFVAATPFCDSCAYSRPSQLQFLDSTAGLNGFKLDLEQQVVPADIAARADHRHGLQEGPGGDEG